MDDIRRMTFASPSYPVRVQPSIASIRQRPSFTRHARAAARLYSPLPDRGRPLGPQPGFARVSRAAAGLHAACSCRPAPRFT